MDIDFFVFDGVTLLDIIGPYEVLRFMPGANLRFVAPKAGEVAADSGITRLAAPHAMCDISSTDILVVPGGPGHRPLMHDEPVLQWLRQIHLTTTWTTSVCGGSCLLAAAGILRGVRATSNWMRLEELGAHGAIPVNERVVRDGKVITGAGVSAGIDFALTLVALEAGEEAAKRAQLGIEYDPQPPFDAGSPDKAPPAMVAAIRARLAAQRAGTS